jgi:hypothetical protein
MRLVTRGHLSMWGELAPPTAPQNPAPLPPTGIGPLWGGA